MIRYVCTDCGGRFHELVSFEAHAGIVCAACGCAFCLPEVLAEHTCVTVVEPVAVSTR